METVVERTESLSWLLEKLAATKKRDAAAQSLSKTPVTKEQKQKEVELWKTWNKNGQKAKDLDPLLKSFAPLIQIHINKLKRAEVPVAAVAHEHKKMFVDALKSWDPKKGALGTWVTWKLKRGVRYVEKYKNPARIPENISQNIGSFNALRAELTEKLGYVPNAQAIHDYALKTKHKSLKDVPLRDFQRMEKEQRKTFIEKGYESEETSAHPILSSRSEEVAYLIMPQLTDHEKRVHELTLGLNGNPRLKPGEIAKKLKMDNSKVAKLRSSIFNKMKPYLGE